MHSTIHCIHLFQKKNRGARHNRYDLVEQVGIEVVEYDEVEEEDRIFQESQKCHRRLVIGMFRVDATKAN